jgi:hypothetical protein
MLTQALRCSCPTQAGGHANMCVPFLNGEALTPPGCPCTALHARSTTWCVLLARCAGPCGGRQWGMPLWALLCCPCAATHVRIGRIARASAGLRQRCARSGFGNKPCMTYSMSCATHRALPPPLRGVPRSRPPLCAWLAWASAGPFNPPQSSPVVPSPKAAIPMGAEPPSSIPIPAAASVPVDSSWLCVQRGLHLARSLQLPCCWWAIGKQASTQLQRVRSSTEVVRGIYMLLDALSRVGVPAYGLGTTGELWGGLKGSADAHASRPHRRGTLRGTPRRSRP